MDLEDLPRNAKSKPTKRATPPRQPDVFTKEAGQAGGSGDGTPSSEGSSLPTDFVINLGYVFFFADCRLVFFMHSI